MSKTFSFDAKGRLPYQDDLKLAALIEERYGAGYDALHVATDREQVRVEIRRGEIPETEFHKRFKAV